MKGLIKLILIFCFGTTSIMSQNSKITLLQAFEKAELENKPLLVIRYDQGLIDYPKIFHDQTDDSQLDSILNVNENVFFLNNNLVVYNLESYSQNPEDISLLDSLILDYSPNFILFDSSGNLIDFYNPIKNNDGNRNVVNSIIDTMNIMKPLLIERLNLENKFKNNQISDNDLYRLIKLRQNVHLKSKNEINDYVLKEGYISNDLIEYINLHEFELNDPIVQYILNNDRPEDEDWIYFQTSTLENVAEQAKKDNKKEDFIIAQKLKEDYLLKINEHMAQTYGFFPIFDKEQGEKAINENDLEENLEFCYKNTDVSGIISSGHKFADFLIGDFKKNQNEYIEFEVSSYKFMQENFKQNFILDSTNTLGNWKIEYSAEKIKKTAESNFNIDMARSINKIAWYFYEKVNDKKELESALKWSKKSLELDRLSLYVDTYAHLLFKLGNIKKAIKFEKEAVELAEKENLDMKISVFEDELQRFISESKKK